MNYSEGPLPKQIGTTLNYKSPLNSPAGSNKNIQTLPPPLQGRSERRAGFEFSEGTGLRPLGRYQHKSAAHQHGHDIMLDPCGVRALCILLLTV